MPEPKVAVVTDTTAYLPAEMLEANELHLVSLYVNWEDGRSERESEILDYDAFYERLRTAEQLPTTSQPSIGDFLAVYEPLLASGRQVVSVHISGGLSGTVESARQARERLGDRAAGSVVVLDSKTGCGGLGLMALAAAGAASGEAGLEEVAERAVAARRGLKMWFAVDTLEYLRKGGRIGAASAWLGTALKVKPILSVDSEITPIERVRTGARALARLGDYANERHQDGADGWVVQHIQAHDEAVALAESTQELMGRPPVWISEIGPVIGAHIGPGLLGIGAIPLHHLERVATVAGSLSGRAAEL